MPHRFLDPSEAAKYLHLAPSDLDRLVKDDEVPHERRGAKVWFRRVELNAWASQRLLGLEGKRLQEYHRQASSVGDPVDDPEPIITGRLSSARINAALPAKTKASVLREMAKLAAGTGKVTDPEALLEGLRAREELCSTGLPGGVAVLHTRSHDPYLFEEPIVMLGRTVQNVPFGAPDGQGTRLFFLLGCVDDRMHLRSMARICVLALRPGFLVSLVEAPDARVMFDLLAGAEAEIVRELAG